MRKILKNKQGYAQVVGTLIALLVVIAIGAMIFFQILGSFDTTPGTPAANVSDDVSDMGSTIFGLLPIIALVVVAAIIIGVVVGMGGSKRGM
jgi:multidrug resistance efflux pump